MTETGEVRLPPVRRQAPATRLALASRGDALTPYLFDALRRRFPVVGTVDPDLTARQRWTVAAATFRPSRRAWSERFWKSSRARALRSANAAGALQRLPGTADAVFQVHLLFDVVDTPNVIYVDCTHRQSAESWPAWNPLRGESLQRWYRDEQRAYERAEHLFAFCEPTRDSLVLDYGIPSEKVTVTGAGANLDRLPQLPAPVPGPPTILFIGNDFVRKGGPVLLEAFRAVRAAMPTARLQLVGAPQGVPAEPGVEVLGRVHDRARIEQLYAGASVFAVPSWFDPYPLVVLEAMAFGLPVVTTRQTGTPEMVVDGGTGLLTRPGRADELAEALLALLRDPEEARALGAAGRRRVEERFTWDHVVDRMAPALSRLRPGGIG